MSLKQSLSEYLATELGVSVNPDISRRKIAPYVVYQLLGADHVRHAGGGSGFTAKRVQVNIYAETAKEVDDLMELLRDKLDAFIGEMGATEILGAALDNEFDGMVWPEDASQTGKHRRTADFTIWHRESVPNN